MKPPAGVQGNLDKTDSNKTVDVLMSIQESLMRIWTDFLAHLPFLIAGIVMVLGTWAAAVVARRIIGRMLERTSLRGSLKELMNRFAVLLVWVTGIMTAAMIVFPGLTPTKALGAMGIVSVAIGLAFKDIFENFFAGVLLLWRFPFEKGDVVACEGLLGSVEHISVRMTQVRPPSGELLVLPNSFLFKNPVRILTAQKHRRIAIIMGIAYGENVEDAVDIIKRAVERCQGALSGRPVEVFPKAFGASSIDIEVAWWSESTPLGVRKSRGEVISAIKSALDDAGVEIPFPHRTLSANEPIQLKIESPSEALQQK